MDADADAHPDATPAPGPTLDNIQAHLLRASKFRGGRTRNWSLFVFFRILTQAEMQATKTRLFAVAKNADAGPEKDLFQLDLAHPRAANLGLTEDLGPCSTNPKGGAASPAEAFLNWLGVLVNGDGAAVLSSVKALLNDLGPSKAMASPKAAVAALARQLQAPPSDPAVQLKLLEGLAPILTSGEAFDDLLKARNADLKTVIAEGTTEPILPSLLICEFLRQAAPAFGSKEGPPTIRSEAVEEARRKAGRDSARKDGRATEPAEATDDRPDDTPITLAFSYSGLEALGLHKSTLRSFPDAFKEGMAARAGRLKDVGASAPEHWEGELGLESVHGYMTGGFAMHDYPVTEAFWKQVRAEIRAFNDGTASGNGRATPKTDEAHPEDQMRRSIGPLFRCIGLEVVHIELGQDPDHVEDDQAAGFSPFAKPTPRREHFGFRDGLSQPFADLGLDDPGPGSGTPARQGTWTPVAPGEIFLDQPDEDGDRHRLPVNETLRAGSTFLVFRKLEQDVPGFRSFLERQRPACDDGDDGKAREALAAQLMGRWKDGTPLVRSPHHPAAQDGPEATLNDFRYAEDDPRGERCPLGAHIRRANPRDIGGRNAVRRHRILRRGISYGGPLLPEGSLGDGEKRGMLFVAANARIDLQFELIQRDWLNGGEFLGQAGLDKCPVTGASAGGVADRFLEAGAGAPITGVPRFLTTRGGDYFFAPGIAALKRIVVRDDFYVPPAELPFGGYSMGDASTPSLFSEERVKEMTQVILNGAQRIVRLRLPGIADDYVSFVGQHADVTRVLENRAYDGRIHFSVRPYREASRRITRGQDMVIGTEHVGDTRAARTRMMIGLDLAWKTLGKALNASSDDPEEFVRQVARERLAMALQRTGPALRVDLVADLASQAAYGVLTDVYGTPGPAWVTELGAALPFSKAHVGSLPPDWLAAFRGEKLADPGLTTMKVWTALLVADLIGNVQSQGVVQALSRQAGSEMLTHIDSLLLAAQARMAKKPAPPVRTLIDAYVTNWSHPEIQRLYGRDGAALYAQDTALVLLEILGSTLAVIPLMFASVMTLFLNNGVDLAALLRISKVDRREALNSLIYEAERLNPNMAVRMRRAETGEGWGTEKIAEKDPVAALVVAANLDPRVFSEPRRFSLDGLGLDKQPRRDPRKYLTFGVRGSKKYCWGAGRVAMPVLEECLDVATRLAGLRRVAGPTGEPQKLAGVTIGLGARFSRVRRPAS